MLGVQARSLGATEQRALAAFVEFVRGRFGARVRELRLFGSRARGEGHEESDLDVLTVVDDLTWRERREVWEQTGDILTEYDAMIGGLTLSTRDWKDLRARERRIVMEIDRDGVPL